MTLANAFAKHGASKIGPASDVIPITPGAGVLTDPDDGTTVYTARALRCSCSGVATVKTAAGKTRTGVPLVAGDNHIAVTHVTAWTPDTGGGTIWGII